MRKPPRETVAVLSVAALCLMTGPALAEDACPTSPPTHHLTLARALPAGDLEVRGVALSPDETQLLAGSNDASVRVWDVASGKLLLRSMPLDGPVWSVAFTRNGRRVLAEGPMGPGEGKFSTHLWDVATGAEIVSRPGGGLGLPTEISTLIETSAPDDPFQVTLVDLIGERAVLHWRNRPYETHRAYAYGPAGPLVLTTSEDGAARFIDARGERDLEPRPGNLGPSDMALAADGRTAFHRGAVWDAETGQRLYEVPVDRQRSALQHPIFSSDGRKLLVAFSQPSGVDDVVVLDARTGAPQAHICGASIITDQKISGDGRFFATNTPSGAAIWDAMTGALLARLYGPRFEISDFALSHDGQILVTGSADGVVRVWRLEAGDGPIPTIAPRRPRPG